MGRPENDEASQLYSTGLMCNQTLASQHLCNNFLGRVYSTKHQSVISMTHGIALFYSFNPLGLWYEKKLNSNESLTFLGMDITCFLYFQFNLRT